MKRKHYASVLYHANRKFAVVNVGKKAVWPSRPFRLDLAESLAGPCVGARARHRASPLSNTFFVRKLIKTGHLSVPARCRSFVEGRPLYTAYMPPRNQAMANERARVGASDAHRGHPAHRNGFPVSLAGVQLVLPSPRPVFP